MDKCCMFLHYKRSWLAGGKWEDLGAKTSSSNSQFLADFWWMTEWYEREWTSSESNIHALLWPNGWPLNFRTSKKIWTEWNNKKRDFFRSQKGNHQLLLNSSLSHFSHLTSMVTCCFRAAAASNLNINADRGKNAWWTCEFKLQMRVDSPKKTNQNTKIKSQNWRTLERLNHKSSTQTCCCSSLDRFDESLNDCLRWPSHT